MKGKRVMVVAAHVDDADFYCGGAVALWARQGAEITYLVCTDGSLGSLDPAVSPEQIAGIRKKEQAAANEVLGVRETIYLDYPDMSLRFDDALWRAVTRLYRERRPEIVLTFDPWLRYEQHIDHTAAGTAGFYAQLAARNMWKFTGDFERGLKPWDVREMYLFKTGSPNTWIDVEDVLETKLAALNCHVSQFSHLVPPGEAGMEVLRQMSHRHPETGRIAERLRHIPLSGIEGLKSYINLE
jgi:LmbE family N-acetylglucosaminyl deacetylase